jgi:hypothetical protein
MANSNGAYPNLNIDIGQSAQRPTKRPISTLEQTVEGALREVLAWRPRTTDPKGFQSALNQAFTASEINGRSEWTWTPRSYSVHADMGAITGAQASIYTRAKAALDQITPLIEGLYPLRNDPDPEDIEAIRALVQSHLTELIEELGVVGGPRLLRVNGLFQALLGEDLDMTSGDLTTLRDRLGLEPSRVNTITEEQNLTNYHIVVDHVIGLHNSWTAVKLDFSEFLGTQVIRLSRMLNVIAESVQELEFKMDSVWLGEAERQTTKLGSGLTIAELLGWVERFASEEAPRLIEEAGKDGILALQPMLKKLQELVKKAWEESKKDSDNPQPGFHTERVRTGWQELLNHIERAKKEAKQTKREPEQQYIQSGKLDDAIERIVRLENDMYDMYDLKIIVSDGFKNSRQEIDSLIASRFEEFKLSLEEAIKKSIRPEIYSIFPQSARLKRSVKITILGRNLNDSEAVRLITGEDSSTILEGIMTENAEDKITATFNLGDPSATPGMWYLELEANKRKHRFHKPFRINNPK